MKAARGRTPVTRCAVSKAGPAALRLILASAALLSSACADARVDAADTVAAADGQPEAGDTIMQVDAASDTMPKALSWRVQPLFDGAGPGPACSGDGSFVYYSGGEHDHFDPGCWPTGPKSRLFRYSFDDGSTTDLGLSLCQEELGRWIRPLDGGLHVRTCDGAFIIDDDVAIPFAAPGHPLDEMGILDGAACLRQQALFASTHSLHCFRTSPPFAQVFQRSDLLESAVLGAWLTFRDHNKRTWVSRDLQASPHEVPLDVTLIRAAPDEGALYLVAEDELDYSAVWRLGSDGALTPITGPFDSYGSSGYITDLAVSPSGRFLVWTRVNGDGLAVDALDRETNRHSVLSERAQDFVVSWQAHSRSAYDAVAIIKPVEACLGYLSLHDLEVGSWRPVVGARGTVVTDSFERTLNPPRVVGPFGAFAGGRFVFAEPTHDPGFSIQCPMWLDRARVWAANLQGSLAARELYDTGTRIAPWLLTHDGRALLAVRGPGAAAQCWYDIPERMANPLETGTLFAHDLEAPDASPTPLLDDASFYPTPCGDCFLVPARLHPDDPAFTVHHVCPQYD